MPQFAEEKLPLSPTVTIQVYRRRWWILAVFCGACVQQAMMWNTWGPIAESAELVLGWTDSNIAMVANLASISYMFLVIPFSMLMDTKGLRYAMVVCSSLIFFSALIRCFSLEPSAATVAAYSCALIKGTATSIPYAGPPLVAAVWFPPAERPTATAIGSFFNYFGLSLSFIIGPQLVTDPEYYVADLQNERNLSQNDTVSNLTNRTGPVVLNIDRLRQGILNLLYTHATTAGILLIIIIVYFPAKPPKPPSRTASIESIDYKQAMRKILRNGPLWLIVLAGAIPLGVLGVWIAILDVVVKPLGVSQIDAGWMGFWHSLIGNFSGIFIAKFSVFFHRRRKLFLLILFTCGTAFCVWFAVLCSGFVGHDLASLYTSCILLGIFVNGPVPLFYDMSAEASYPVAEGVTSGFYTLTGNIFGTIFLSLVSVPSLGTSWMNWVALGSLAAAIPMLCVFQERYKRTDIDLQNAGEK